MAFNSLTFLLVFLPATLAVYHLSRGARTRNAVLLVASVVFYAFGGLLPLALLAGSVAFNWACGLLLSRYEHADRARKIVLAVGVAANLGLLVVFKYAGFFIRQANRVVPGQLPRPHLLIPTGVSFFTFLALSYLFDVYRGRAEARRSLGHVALYLGDFLTIQAGPIARYEQLSPRLDERPVRLAAVARGAERFAIGLAKKLIIAGPLGALVAEVAKVPPSRLSTATAWISALAFTAQIYFDFSGYSDMAIGLGSMFGFTLPENFDYPYTSRSVAEFWRRWHMTLGRWFREYVYIPLGGNRSGTLLNLRNLFVVWLLTGLWHGAAGRFVLWGLYYGTLIALERYVLRDVLERTWAPLRHAYVMLAVVFGWVLFAAPSLAGALAQARTMLGIGGGPLADHLTVYYLLKFRFEFLVAAVGSLPLVPYLRALWRRREPAPALRTGLVVARPVAVAALLVVSLSYAVYTTFSPFLYAKF
jgi:alginate O-acetyltransferase complex protein AlgI